MTLREFYNKGLQNKADKCSVFDKHGKRKVDIERHWDAKILYEDIRFMVGSHKTLIVLRVDI